MKRRKFMSLVGAVATASPYSTRAQSPGKPRIGMALRRNANSGQRDREIIIAALRDLGWIDGQNVTLDVREHDAEIEDLVRLKVDVLFLVNPNRLQIGSKLTQTIPIVGYDLESDPVASGYAQSLARPGRNITGIWLDIPEIAGKQLQYLEYLVPDLRRVAVLWDDRLGVPFKAMETAARSEGISIQAAAVPDESQIESAIERLKESQPQALLAMTAPWVARAQGRIAELALLNHLPSMCGFTTFPAVGGLMAYGPDYDVALRHAVSYIDRILKGAKPADLPIERPTKFQLALNLKTAKSLGLTVPPALLARADEMIE
jgi:putative ABC transport system substrate-binding protein